MMAGGTARHALIAANVVGFLRSSLRGRSCNVYSSDLKVRIEDHEVDRATYPDASVVCGAVEHPPEDKNGVTCLNPKVLVEVLSPSTADYDRTEKLAIYKRIPSLVGVLHIEADSCRAVYHARSASGRWESRTYEADQTIQLSGIDVDLPLSEIYLDVVL